jgi:hypothetical protein
MFSVLISTAYRWKFQALAKFQRSAFFLCLLDMNGVVGDTEQAG